jgi:hypothetical protein
MTLPSDSQFNFFFLFHNSLSPFGFLVSMSMIASSFFSGHRQCRCCERLKTRPFASVYSSASKGYRIESYNPTIESSNVRSAKGFFAKSGLFALVFVSVACTVELQ